MKKLPTKPGSTLRHKTGAIAVLLDNGEWLHADEYGWFLMSGRDFYEGLEGWSRTNPFHLDLQINFPWLAR